MPTKKPSFVRRVLVQPVEQRVRELAEAYESQQGLTRQQALAASFVSWFPGNIAAIFVFAVVLFASIYAIITFSVGSHSVSGPRLAEIKAEKLKQLEAIHAADKAGDHDAFAKATLALEAIEAAEQAPQTLETALLSLVSLVIAVTGIFSMPLLMSLTIDFAARRFAAASAAVDQII
jgi:hypothetical protein